LFFFLEIEFQPDCKLNHKQWVSVKTQGINGNASTLGLVPTGVAMICGNYQKWR
jgi:hypothetical protein